MTRSWYVKHIRPLPDTVTKIFPPGWQCFLEIFTNNSIPSCNCNFFQFFRNYVLLFLDQLNFHLYFFLVCLRFCFLHMQLFFVVGYRGKVFFLPHNHVSFTIEFSFPHSSMMLPLLSKEFLHILSIFMSFKTVFYCLSVLGLVLLFFFWLLTFLLIHLEPSHCLPGSLDSSKKTPLLPPFLPL